MRGLASPSHPVLKAGMLPTGQVMNQARMLKWLQEKQTGYQAGSNGTSPTSAFDWLWLQPSLARHRKSHELTAPPSQKICILIAVLAQPPLQDLLLNFDTARSKGRYRPAMGCFCRLGLVPSTSTSFSTIAPRSAHKKTEAALAHCTAN